MEADYVTVVEDRPIMSAEYRFTRFGQNWPTQQSHGICDSWATCFNWETFRLLFYLREMLPLPGHLARVKHWNIYRICSPFRKKGVRSRLIKGCCSTAVFVVALKALSLHSRESMQWRQPAANSGTRNNTPHLCQCSKLVLINCILISILCCNWSPGGFYFAKLQFCVLR